MESVLVMVIVTVSFATVAMRFVDWVSGAFIKTKKQHGCAGCGTHGCTVKLKKLPLE